MNTNSSTFRRIIVIAALLLTTAGLLTILLLPLLHLSDADVEDHLCPTIGWGEGLMVNARQEAPFPVDDTASNPDYHCPFHQWSWEAFVWAIGPNDTPRFLSLPTPAQLGTGNSAPPPVLQLKHRNRKTDENDTAIGGAEQASGQALIDPHGQAVYYTTHMNDIYFRFANDFYGKSNYEKAAPNTNFPVGSAVFKSSWRIVNEAAPAGNAYTIRAQVPYLKNSSTHTSGVEAEQRTRTVTVALVGLHVVGVTENHPEFLWGTFEHIDNAPDLTNPDDYDSDKAVSSRDYTFYRANTSAKASNLGQRVNVTNAQTQTLTPTTNVFRQYATGGESKADSDNIAAMNEQAQGSILSPGSVLSKVWANYKLIGTVWQDPNSLTAGDSQLDQSAVGSVQLANATMETFVQGPQSNQGKPANCFMCHNTAGITVPSEGGEPGIKYPGKNINLSHALINAITGK